MIYILENNKKKIACLKTALVNFTSVPSIYQFKFGILRSRSVDFSFPLKPSGNPPKVDEIGTSPRFQQLY